MMSTGSMEKMSTNKFHKMFWSFQVHPRKLTCALKNDGWKTISFLLKWSLFRRFAMPSTDFKICLSLDICQRVFDRYVFGSSVLPNLSSVCDWILDV